MHVPFSCQVHIDYPATWGRHGRDHMVVGFIATCVISVYHRLSCEFEPR